MGDVVDGLAVALTRNPGRAIRLQLDIASQDDLDRAIDPTSALRQLGPGLLSDLSYSLTPGLASRILRQCLAVQHVIPGNFCYNSHYSIPLTEGLTVGL
jgi:hypothetical protein